MLIQVASTERASEMPRFGERKLSKPPRNKGGRPPGVLNRPPTARIAAVEPKVLPHNLLPSMGGVSRESRHAFGVDVPSDSWGRAT